jgi:hypothetical protein
MANSHGLRTTGRPTGNFGKAKVQGRPGELDLTKEILTKENLRIPDRDEVYARLVIAYNTTDDPRLKAGLWEILKKRIATVKPSKPPVSFQQEETHWDIIKRTR